MSDLESLDLLLRAWAKDHCLGSDEAEEVLRSVVAQPIGLSATWWEDFGTQMGVVITKATQASSSAFGFPSPALAFGN